MVTNERDVEYIPDFGGDNEGDYQEEVATSVGVPQKVIRLTKFLLFYFYTVLL